MRARVVLAALLLAGATTGAGAQPNRVPSILAPGGAPSISNGAAPDGGGVWTVVSKGSNTDITNNTVLASDADLCFTTATDGRYEFQAWIKFAGDGSPGAVPGLKFLLVGPAGATGGFNTRTETINGSGITTALSAETGCILNSGTCLALTTHTLGGLQYATTLLLVPGMIFGPRTPTAGGSACLQFANQSNGGTTRIFAGSVLAWRSIP